MAGLHLAFDRIDDDDISSWDVISYCGEYGAYSDADGEYDAPRHTTTIGRVIEVDGEFFFIDSVFGSKKLKSEKFDDHPHSGWDVMHEVVALVGSRENLDRCDRCLYGPPPHQYID